MLFWPEKKRLRHACRPHQANKHIQNEYQYIKTHMSQHNPFKFIQNQYKSMQNRCKSMQTHPAVQLSRQPSSCPGDRPIDCLTDWPTVKQDGCRHHCSSGGRWILAPSGYVQSLSIWVMQAIHIYMNVYLQAAASAAELQNSMNWWLDGWVSTDIHYF